MTKEALKLALEALEASHLLIHGSETKGGVRDYIDGYYSGCFDFVSNKNQINEVITTIKEALAKPNFCPRCGKRLGTNDWDIHTCTPPQRKPLTDEEILADETLRYYFGLNGGAGPVSKQGRKIVNAIEAAHGIKGEA